MSEEKVEISAVLAWWIKNKNKVYGIILVAIGMLGGNADRISKTIADILPDGAVVPANDLEPRIDTLESNQAILRQDVNNLKAIVENIGTGLSRKIPIK